MLMVAPKKSKKMAKKTAAVDRYKSIGFMCGLEIHQRLATKEKLFCSCSTNVLDRSAKPNATVTRFQRAVAGELGSIDKSAEFEEGKNRSFIYHIFDGNTCLVDIDEDPPHALNGEALSIALSIASAMGIRIIDELQPMRKSVVDGSDPSAFQRSVMIGLDGSINVNGLKVNVPSIFLEEESSGIVSSSSSSVTYNTDRLGIPLIEIDTDPYIPNPKAAKDIALYIGTLLRLTGAVQRGIGSIRQDVNLSIRDGARVEIKGVQELSLIDSFLENEIKRQENLIIIKDRLVKAKATVGKATNVTPIFRDTNVDVIKYHIKDGAVFAFPLTGFGGLLGFEINPNRRLGTEISDYAKMAGVHGIIHSDEDLNKYRFSADEISALRKQLKISDNDSFMIVAGKPDDVKRASELAIWRAEYSLKGVPKETRVAHDNQFYTSRFLRPLPTGSRMYPETDIRPIMITKDMRDNALNNAPNVESERKYLGSLIKNEALVDQLILSPRLHLFKAIVKQSTADPEFVANVLIQRFTELRRNGINVDSIKDETVTGIFVMYAEEKITKQAVEEALKIMSKENGSIEALLSRSSLLRIKGNELRALVETIKKTNKNMGADGLRNSIMSKYRLTVDGSELNKLLAKTK